MYEIKILGLGYLKGKKKSHGFCTVYQQVFFTVMWKKVLFTGVRGMFEQGGSDNILGLKAYKCISLETKHVLPLQPCSKIPD